MSSRAPHPSPRRAGLIVWARRLWLSVWAWRLLAAPIVPDPKRDLSLRVELFRAKGCACSVCGEETASWEAEHSRPLVRGGRDELRNMTPMCVVCHRIKSAAEARVLGASRRLRARAGFLTHRPSPPVAIFGTLFLAGFISTRWVLFCLVALALLWFGPPMWRKHRPSFTGRSMPGGGFNRQPDFDRILEERQSGMAGRVSRIYWWWRRLFFSARYLPMAAMLAYLAGVYLRHFGVDTVVIIARVLF